MLSQPVLQVREFDGPRLNQVAVRKPTDPVIGHIERRSNFPMLPNFGLYGRPRLLDSLFDAHFYVATILTTASRDATIIARQQESDK